MLDKHWVAFLSTNVLRKMFLSPCRVALNVVFSLEGLAASLLETLTTMEILDYRGANLSKQHTVHVALATRFVS